MSDYWNRPRPRPQRERDDRDRHPHQGGGYFQGEPGRGNNPGSAPDPDRHGSPDRYRGDDYGRDAGHYRPTDNRGYDARDNRDNRDGWTGGDRARGMDRDMDRDMGRDMGRGMGHGMAGPRDPVHGEAGRGYGGLSRRDYADRGPGRVFDRGEDYGRGDTYSPARAGHGSRDPGEQPRRHPDDRGLVDRAADEVATWFGDDDAQRRRRLDEQQDRRDQQGYRRRDW